MNAGSFTTNYLTGCSHLHPVYSAKEKIYLATMHGALHIINNLLNQLKIVELEIKNNPDFDKEISELFDNMLFEASSLLKEFSSVKTIEAEEIIKSICPK